MLCQIHPSQFWTKLPEKKDEIEHRRKACGQGKARMLQWSEGDENGNENDICHQADETNLEWCPSVLEGIEGRSQDSCSCNGPDANRIAEEGFCSHFRCQIIEY